MVETATIISDSVIFIRNFLRGEITDPLGAKRTDKQVDGDTFILSGYSKKSTVYPIITVRKSNFILGQRLGMQTEKYYATLEIEIRIWARNEKERDVLTDSVMTKLNDNQFPTGTTDTSSNVGLHDFKILSVVGVDNPHGENGVLSSIITIQNKFLYGF